MSAPFEVQYLHVTEDGQDLHLETQAGNFRVQHPAAVLLVRHISQMGSGSILETASLRAVAQSSSEEEFSEVLDFLSTDLEVLRRCGWWRRPKYVSFDTGATPCSITGDFLERLGLRFDNERSCSETLVVRIQADRQEDARSISPTEGFLLRGHVASDSLRFDPLQGPLLSQICSGCSARSGRIIEADRLARLP